MTITIEDAAKEAEDAAGKIRELERRAVEEPPETRPAAAEVAAARVEAQHAQLRVEFARRKAEEAAEARRQAALHAVGADLKAYADTDPAAEVRDALGDAVTAVQAYWAKANEHDAAVADLNARAGALALPGPRPWRDPWERQLAGGTYQGIAVSKFGDQARIALEQALRDGDVESAAAKLVAVKSTVPPEASYYLKDTLPQFGIGIPVFGKPDRNTAELVRTGRFVRMSEAEVDAWLKNRR